VTAPIRVLLVDDHALVCRGVAATLRGEPDLDVVATAGTGEEGLRLVATLQPDVAVIDYSLPGMTGVDLCRAIRARQPDLAVVMLTSFRDRSIIDAALEAGATGFVCKDIDLSSLRDAIRLAAAGTSVYDPKVEARVRDRERRAVREAGPMLSPREVEVLRLVDAGSTNRDIAEKLGLTEHSVKTYLTRAMRKFGCHQRGEAAALAAHHGLLGTPEGVVNGP
jgi:DNA-binding NarL/FixJ family response regulator